jgi:hypothetical protein
MLEAGDVLFVDLARIDFVEEPCCIAEMPLQATLGILACRPGSDQERPVRALGEENLPRRLVESST